MNRNKFITTPNINVPVIQPTYDWENHMHRQKSLRCSVGDYTLYLEVSAPVEGTMVIKEFIIDKVDYLHRKTTEFKSKGAQGVGIDMALHKISIQRKFEEIVNS